jgi:protein SCO1
MIAMPRVFYTVACITAACAVYALASHRGSAPPPDAATALTDRLDRIRNRLPNIALHDHTGRAVRFHDLIAGRRVAINFMYASCSKTCEVSSQNLSRLQIALGERLGRDVMMYSISLDPDRDTWQALATYREKQGAMPGWTFLLPESTADVTVLRRALGVFEPDEALDGDLSSHTGMLVLGNETTGRWSMVPSLLHPIRLRQSIERMILPPSQWASGSAVVSEVPREDSDTSLRR